MTGATSTTILKGQRVLVVEDEYMIAEELVETLVELGAEALGPVARVADALRLVAAEARIDGALLDVNLCGEPVWPVVDALLARGIPMALATGYDAGAIPAAYVHLPRCQKPAKGRDFARALARAMGRFPAGSQDPTTVSAPLYPR